MQSHSGLRKLKMADLKKLVRENVLKLTPYSCARDEFQGNDGIFMDANENPYGSLNRYPDPYQKKLKTAISEIKNMPVENIFLGNGSDEIIDLCFRTFCNPGIDKTMIFPPTYGMYEVSASVNDVRVLRVPLDASFQINTERVKELAGDPHLKLIFICSPNNPTGNAMDADAVEWIIRNTGSIVVIDEAYADFSTKPSFISLTQKYNNLIVMQTFSKALGMAAGRVGMAFADAETVKLFNKIKPPYNISSINQKAALSRLERSKDYKVQAERIKGERLRLAGALEKFSFVEKVYPSDANFLLVKVADANKLYNYLIQRNIVVRNRHGVVENCIRITTGTKNENNELIKALKKFS
jgi:histidinol-phosphate aminotransferase